MCSCRGSCIYVGLDIISVISFCIDMINFQSVLLISWKTGLARVQRRSGQLYISIFFFFIHIFYTVALSLTLGAAVLTVHCYYDM